MTLSESVAQEVLAIFAAAIGRAVGQDIPTGKEAHYRGEGPELVLDWRPMTWYADQADPTFYDPNPTILWEGAEPPLSDYCYEVQKILDERGIKVFVEPFFSYAVVLYPS